MNRLRSYKAASVVGAFLAFGYFALASLGACSNQGEGERCDSANQSDDCQSGLLCYQSAILVGTSSDRCCPSDRALATTPVCKQPVSGIGDAAAPPDTGPVSTPDATVNEASTDANSASDAPADG